MDDVDCSAAYIEFADPESVKSALMFSGNTFHDRTLVVEPKRKNLPRFMLHRGREVFIVAPIVRSNALFSFPLFPRNTRIHQLCSV